jgi:ribosomal-protein-alanine N-acetyltransferase
LKNKNCSEVFLEVRVSNSEAVGLYEKLGFKVVSNLRWYYRDGEDAYMMARAL